jgi:hypothetical protein
MRPSGRFIALAACTIVALAMPLSVSADVGDAVSTYTYTKNLKPLGHSARNVALSGSAATTGAGQYNSDIAFWGKTAIQGSYNGFRIIDIADPENPFEISRLEDCVTASTNGSQGDIVVYDNVLVRSWDAPRGTTAARMCSGLETPANQEGVHIYDISNPAAPVVVKFIQTPCGSHTATGVPDPANNRLLVYSSASSGSVGCRGLDIIEVPLDDLAGASYLRQEPSGVPFTGLPNFVTVDGVGTFAASGSNWHPDPTVDGVSGPIVIANGPSDLVGSVPSNGCGAFVGFPAGAIALVDRGPTGCSFLQKVHNAQDAGAVGVIIANNVTGTPGAMAGEDHTIEIPTAMVSLEDGVAIKASLPRTGRIHRNPAAVDIDRSCHDTAVILGEAMMVACAGGNGITAWTLDPAKGGSLENPELLYSMNHGTGIGHTAAFTFDGKYIIFGHEPGGGTQARCQATSLEFDRTIWFLDAETGETVGEFLHPRPQTNTENCTWHNLNIVPTDKRYVFVSGNYQSGISVVDFTDPTNAREIAFADPAPLINPDNAAAIESGGNWSTYWYNGRVYESDMTRGLTIWNLTDPAVAGATKFPFSNPQTLMTSAPFKGTAGG